MYIWRIWLVALAAVTLAASVRAGYDEGFSAAQRQDYVRAANEWLPLAQNNIPEAQVSFGWLQFHGLGTAQDRPSAYAWTVIGGRVTNDAEVRQQAIANLNVYRPSMSAAEITQADQMVAGYFAQAPSGNAQWQALYEQEHSYCAIMAEGVVGAPPDCRPIALKSTGSISSNYQKLYDYNGVTYVIPPNCRSAYPNNEWGRMASFFGGMSKGQQARQNADVLINQCLLDRGWIDPGDWSKGKR